MLPIPYIDNIWWIIVKGLRCTNIHPPSLNLYWSNGNVLSMDIGLSIASSQLKIKLMKKENDIHLWSSISTLNSCLHSVAYFHGWASTGCPFLTEDLTRKIHETGYWPVTIATLWFQACLQGKHCTLERKCFLVGKRLSAAESPFSGIFWDPGSNNTWQNSFLHQFWLCIVGKPSNKRYYVSWNDTWFSLIKKNGQ